jgi:hypothetical protein
MYGISESEVQSADHEAFIFLVEWYKQRMNILDKNYKNAGLPKKLAKEEMLNYISQQIKIPVIVKKRLDEQETAGDVDIEIYYTGTFTGTPQGQPDSIKFTELSLSAEKLLEAKKDEQKQQMLSVLIHEREHIFRMRGSIEIIDQWKKKQAFLQNGYSTKDSYKDNSDEIKSRLMEIRKLFELDPKKKYTLTEVQHLRERNPSTNLEKNLYDNFLNRYRVEFLLFLINEVA